MKVPMSWFGDYTDISGVSPKEYNDALTMSGSKVEGIEFLGKELDRVVSGKINSVTPHPDSDHLVICMVDVGGEVLQIVTGAPNVKEGQIVPVALDGSTLPNGVKIKKGKLRGVESNGMLCSHDEMGITEADLGYEPEYGILILPEDTEIGIEMRDYFGLNENVVEFEITSNRPDCFSVIGLARETAVTFDKPFNVPVPKYTENSENINDYVSVEVKNPEKCLRYSAKMVKNVKIGPSPKWLAARLRACGVRSINNIVDITNYLLLEYGQPMHAFDLRDLVGGKIVVRDAADGEAIKTLDEQDRTLTANDLVIADGERAVAVAGVMGGFNSEVKSDTTTVVFESATFDGASVRQTAQRLGLRTEASSRYEKGLDANNTVPALERACELVQMLGCGEVVGGMIDVKGNIRPLVTLTLRPAKINAFLGTDIPTADMISTLTKLGFEVDEANMTVTAPSFRPDIESEADVAEEIARFYGYDKIPSTLLSGEATVGGKTPLQKLRDKINRTLVGCGMSEIYTYTFTSPSDFDKIRIPADSSLRNTVKITNPLGEDTSIMRTTTIASMLNILSYNYSHRNENVALFEIGKIYLPKGDVLPEEPEKITLGLYGDYDFFALKGIVELLADTLNIDGMEFARESENPTFHTGRCAKVTIDGKDMGVIGEIHPDVLKAYGLDTSCYVAELDLAAIFAAAGGTVKYKQLPKFPAAQRDIALLVDKSVAVADLEKTIRKASGEILDSVKLFDVYEGAQIPEGKKSVAYAIFFRASDRSLTNEEISKVFTKITKDLEYKNGAVLR
ncbi:MAG: phenylalanine--tRNA ligase subunit beta [Clostridia bacterium]|nr:phenylalanine--tRNA ligase subunit beta [Clostridia bacterium]